MKSSFKILVVDDEQEHRDTYRIILESRGYLVREARLGIEALNILEEEYYPLILCDLVMPGLDGIEVLKNVKEIYGENIEVILITGYGGIKSAVEAIKLGAFGYFVKGHNPEELILEVAKAKKLVNLRNKYKSVMDNNDKKDFYNKAGTLK